MIEHITHVEDIEVCEVNDRIAICVCRRGVNEIQIVAVPVKADAIGKRNDRQGSSVGAVICESGSYIVLRDDYGTGICEIRIAARVITVPVRIDDIVDITAADFANGRLDFVAERCELIVDDERTVVTDRKSDVAALTDEHVYALDNRNGFDLDIGEIILGNCRDADCEQARKAACCFSFHGYFPAALLSR